MVLGMVSNPIYVRVFAEPIPWLSLQFAAQGGLRIADFHPAFDTAGLISVAVVVQLCGARFGLNAVA